MKKTKTYKRIQKASLFFVSLIVLLVGCNNFFSPIVDKETDEALMYQARKQLDEGNFSGCVKSLSNLEKPNDESHFLKAKCYAGACGLDFIKLAQELTESNFSNTLFAILMKSQKDFKQQQEPQCLSSIHSISEIDSEAANREKNHNLLMLYVSLTYLGGLLGIVADKDDNGEVDDGWNPCTEESNPVATVTKSYVAFSHANLALTALTQESHRAGAGLWLDTLERICSTDCITTEESEVQPLQQTFMRCLQASSEVGLLDDNCYSEHLGKACLL